MKRYCLECVSFRYYEGEAAYSDVTPGCEARMYCTQDHWSLDLYWDGQKELREYFSMADTCGDFAPDPELVEIGRDK